MKNRLISLFLAAIATVFAAVIIFAMTEVRYSKIENHIANSARIITENNAKTAFLGYFHWDSMYEALESGDADFVIYNLEDLLKNNSLIEGVVVVYRNEEFVSAGESFQTLRDHTIGASAFYEIIPSGEDLLATMRVTDSAGLESLKDSYAILKLNLDEILRLLTTEDYRLSSVEGTSVFEGISLSIIRKWSPANYATVSLVFLMSLSFTMIVQRLEGKRSIASKNNEMLLLLNHIPTLIWYFKDSETFGIVNKSFAEFFGMRPEDIEGRKIREIFSGEDLSTSIETNKLVFAGKEEHIYEQDTRNSKGELRTLIVTKTPEIDENGNIKSVVCSACDVTDERKALRRIELIQFGLDNANDEAFWIAPDGSILYANSAACKSLGYSREEITAMKVNDLDKSLEADDRKSSWERLKSNGKDNFEAYHLRKDGSTFPVEINRNYFKYDGREYEFTFARDISDRLKSFEIL
ncbi:PAS domain S-box protein, partial [Mesotoga prima]